MKAIILAAGQGKRLRPLTNNVPKCMVKLFGKSLLEWQIKTFQGCNIHDISVVTGYQSNSIKFPNITYFKNEKYATTNMVETLFCAKEKLNEGVIVSYGDIIFEKQILENLIKSKDEISIVIDLNWRKYWKIRFDNPLEDAESLILDENGYIKNIGQKVKNADQIQGQYIGLMKFEKKGLENLIKFYKNIKKISNDSKNPLNDSLPFEKSYMTDLLQGMINNGYNLKALKIRGGWLELDSFNDYEVYQKMYHDGTLRKLISISNFSE